VPSPTGGATTLLPGFYPWGYGPWGYGAYGYGLGGAGLYDYYGYYGGFGYGGYGGLGYGGFGYSGFGGGYFGAGDDIGLGLGSYGPGYSRAYGVYDPYAPSAPYNADFTGVSASRPSETGALRLKLKPEKASVYVDGVYVGHSDQYGGMFHKLHLDAGNHRVEIRAPGYETLTFNVRIERDHTQTYRGELEKAAR
jgi:hypothetical protein